MLEQNEPTTSGVSAGSGEEDFFAYEGFHRLSFAMVEQAMSAIVKHTPEESEERLWLASDAGHVFFKEAFPSLIPSVAIEQILVSEKVAGRLFDLMRSGASGLTGLRDSGVSGEGVLAGEIEAILVAAEAEQDLPAMA